MIEKNEEIPKPGKLRSKIASAIGITVIGVSSLTACSQQSECGQTVELIDNQTPDAFLDFDNKRYSLYVDDKGDVRRISLSEGASMQDQLHNIRHSVDLVGNGTEDTGSLLIDDVKISLTSAAGLRTVDTSCEKVN